jgi:hypothetical protein
MIYNSVKCYEIEIPSFGLLIRRNLKIRCGRCGYWFEDKPVLQNKMISICPHCYTPNELPVTEAR